MYPKSIAEYMPTDSERLVYYELKNQLPDSFEVFYSVKWTDIKDGKIVKSESDFVVTSSEYGFLCLEVKGGSNLSIKDNVWYVGDTLHGDRKLHRSPYDQAEESMYYFKNQYSNRNYIDYPGIFGAAAVFPFHAIGEEDAIDNRHREITIDQHDLNNLYSKIKRIFKFYNKKPYGWYYPANHHKTFLELVRERLAISAAAGALVQYKDQQLNVINRVQDNYVYLLQNIRQFYMKGGAGTGKTWIAKKMAEKEASFGKKTLFLCASKCLAEYLREITENSVEVRDIRSLFEEIITDFEMLQGPYYIGVYSNLKNDLNKYDAIFVDEAQDFSEECAKTIKHLLKDSEKSILGVFYDDVQILRQDSFGEGFGISTPPFLLHENIRNTSNIYNWTAEKTNLGTDMVSNPVEGPTPQTETINSHNLMTQRLEILFKRYIDDEHLPNSSMILIVDNKEEFMEQYKNGIAKWSFVGDKISSGSEIRVASILEYKGLEADMVVYIHSPSTTDNMNYIAYTRAKYYLLELVRGY